MRVLAFILALTVASVAQAVTPYWTVDATFKGATVELEREGDTYVYSCPDQSTRTSTRTQSPPRRMVGALPNEIDPARSSDEKTCTGTH